MPATLGIVVPTLNAGATIAATLQSLEGAIDAGTVVLVIDGGSIDDTLAQVERFGVRHASCAGNMYDAINDGCQRLATPWLTWLNADDVLYGVTIAERIAAADPGDDVLYGLVDFIDADGRFLHSWRPAASSDLLRLYRSGYSPLLQQGTVFRRRVFDCLGGFRSSYRLVADADFWWRAAEARMGFREMGGPPAAGFRVHSGQLSQVHASAMRSEHERMVHDRGIEPGLFSGLWPALRFRGRNARNYVIRLCRHREVAETWRLRRSYDIPTTDEISGPSSNLPSCHDTANLE